MAAAAMAAGLLAGALAGCAAPAAAPADAAYTPRPPTPDLARFYAQELEWRECGRVECASLEVPVDYADPDGPTLPIAVLRSPATGQASGALVVNPGGPGASGLDYARAASSVVTEAVRDSYDVIGFDPRGVGESAPVECADDADFDRLISVDGTPDSPGEVAELERVSGLLDCSSPIDGLPDHMSTAEAARDLDVLRAALGQEQLDYLGVSYGTHLGATYAALFPDRVGRFVLDGPLPATLDAEALTLGQALGFENALRRFIDYCTEEGDCPLGETSDAGMQRLRAVLDQLDAAPAPTLDPERPLTESAATYAILMSLYRASDRPVLRDALASLVAGDGTPLQRMLDERVGRQADGTYRDNAFDAFYAISCSDRALPTDVGASVDRLASAAPFLGEYLAWGNLPCASRQANPAPLAAGTSPPVLVVATTHDPATPFAWAELLVDQLGDAVLLVREGDGHTGYREGSRCVDEAVDAFLLEGELPESRLVCD
jgi:pimeloyl-ACP methyl ester carboxylesterase